MSGHNSNTSDSGGLFPKFNTSKEITDITKNLGEEFITDGGKTDLTNVTTQVNDIDGVKYPQGMIAFGSVCMILLATLSIVANFISILALCKSKRLRRITTAFIVNLCVANFFVSCCTFTSSVVVFSENHWNGGDRICKFYNILIFFFALVSILTLTTITVNRYVLIVHPRFYYAIFCWRNTIIIIGSLWTVSLVKILLCHFKVWGEYGYDPHTGECAKINSDGSTEIYSFILYYILPLVLFIVCYVKIFFVVRRTERDILKRDINISSYVGKLSDKYWLQEQENESTPKSYKYLRNMKERRLFQIILAVFVCFILCYIPLSVMKMFRKEREHPSLYIVCHLGVHLSNVLNPVIYIFMSEDYRKAYKDLFRCNSENQ